MVKEIIFGSVFTVLVLTGVFFVRSHLKKIALKFGSSGRSGFKM